MGRRRAPHRVWLVAARTTAALGLVCCVATWGLWRPLAVCIAVAVTAFGVAAALTMKSTRASTRVGLQYGLVTMACAGLLAAFGWAGALLVLVVAVTAPVVRIGLRVGRLSAVTRRARPGDTSAIADDRGSLDGRGTVPPGTADPVGRLVALADMPSADGVLDLDDHALCDVWRRSYVRLGASRAAETRLEVVRLRQVYLDELVRRHPAEVRHWLASGARAAGNPLPFLSRPTHGGTFEDGRPRRRGSEAS
jgi:hypothetical protein